MIRLEEKSGRIFMCLKFNYETHIKLTQSERVTNHLTYL